MAHAVTSQLDRPNLPAVSGMGAFVTTLFLAWGALVMVLGARGAFVATPGAPPLGLLLGLVVPLAVFLIGYSASRTLREFVLSADLRFIVGIQAWRWAGFGFLSLYTYRVLPGIFAWPAGLGDMAIGMTAPFVLMGLLAPSGICRKQKLCGLESFWHPGSYCGSEYRGSCPAGRSQSLRDCYDSSNDAVAIGTDSNIPGADVPDPALDGFVAGATFWRA